MYESDQRHAEIIIKSMGVQKAVATPGSRDDAGKADRPNVVSETPTVSPDHLTATDDCEIHPIHAEAINAPSPLQVDFDEGSDQSPLLGKTESSLYRALAARANYLAQDRPDVQFAVKEIARRMATPRANDWQLLKRLARYLLGAPRGILKYCWQSRPSVVDGYVDADWAGCKRTCRSTSGGALMHGWHCIKTWSSTQATVALSSRESELYALTKGASQAIGLVALAADLGVHFDAKLHTDASATLGIVQRQGLGKLRHISVQYLWVQERVRRGALAVTKVAGADNPADLMTKHLAAQDVAKHCDCLGLERYQDRAGAAPMLAMAERVDGVESEDGHWIEDAETVVRVHARPRTCRFTPLRVAGAPPVKALTGTRITRGVYTDDGENFTVVDNWQTRSTAHARSPRPWIGTTQFWKRSSWKA